jgi:hypothetical protein
VTELKKLSQFVRLIGGPRDGQEFEVFSADKSITLQGYGFKVTAGQDVMCFATSSAHVYERKKAYIGQRGSRSVVFLEYRHERIIAQ